MSKEEEYELILAQLDGLFVKNWVSNFANVSALLYEHFHNRSDAQKDVNWVGFYTTSMNDNTLLLGPFQGKVACQEIQFGKGVCGTSVSERRTIVVDDVHAFPGHIACDAETLSEIVIPMIYKDEVMGVLDIDCKSLNGFDEVDAKYLEIIAQRLADKTGSS